MTALIMVLMLAAFVVLDVVVRVVGRRLEERRLRREREAVLQTAVRLEIAGEVTTLKRAEVPKAKGRILAVDDEPVVLDSFRKILVLDGFSVDTVESGPEALALVQRHDYDFVFTDLKMPGMTGEEVVRAVKHLRPDIDVAVITGYATIDSAVDTMKHGAADYVQKPFTADELTAFARRLLLKRQARLEAQHLPTVRIAAPAVAERAAAHEYCIPGGAFLSPGHAWARIEPGGMLRIGVDDFARKALGAFDRVVLPERGARVRAGEPLFTVERAGRAVRFCAPVAGKVAQINTALLDDPGLPGQSPYERGWVCVLQPDDLSAELSNLRIGKPVVAWYREEIERLRKAGGPAVGGTPSVDWKVIEQEFLAPSALARA